MYPSQAEWCAGTGWRTGESTLFLARFSAMPGPLLVARAVQVLLEEFSSVGSPVGQGAHIHWPRAQVPGLARWRRARLASRHSRQGAHRSPRVWCLVSGVLGSVRPAVVGDLARSACWKWLPLIADTRAYRYLPDSAATRGMEGVEGPPPPARPPHIRPHPSALTGAPPQLRCPASGLACWRRAGPEGLRSSPRQAASAAQRSTARTAAHRITSASHPITVHGPPVARITPAPHSASARQPVQHAPPLDCIASRGLLQPHGGRALARAGHRMRRGQMPTLTTEAPRPRWGVASRRRVASVMDGTALSWPPTVAVRVPPNLLGPQVWRPAIVAGTAARRLETRSPRRRRRWQRGQHWQQRPPARCGARPSRLSQPPTGHLPDLLATPPPRPAQPLTSLPSFWPAPSHFPTLCLFFLLPSPSLRAPPFSANPTPSLPSFWLPPQNLSPPSLCSSKTTTSHLLSSSSLLPLPSHQLHKRTSQRLNIASKPSSSSPAPSGTDTQTRRGHPEPLT
ncbi:hypothetical protein Purlil1_4745 [Purpureocillium lilacinum]|uniref:Uncharacterized protein n=1 Tax=Purpureocillium lilacinum TaxID=33203 RepID=A0ABR0C4S4_PURLI|nr:hypothetical protein Purlil1_4745 [Purpureocillium lilacinum]